MGPLKTACPQNQTDRTVRLLSLKEALQIANTLNLNVLLSEEKISEAIALTTTARSRLLPQVSGLVSGTGQERSTSSLGLTKDSTGGFIPPETTGSQSIFDTRLRLHSPLLNLKVLEEYRASKANQKLAELQLPSVREEARAIVISYYFQALRNREEIKFLESNVQRYELLVTLTEDTKAAGMGTDLEITEAKVKLATARNQLKAAQAELNRILWEFKKILGIGLDEPIQLIDTLSFAPIQPLPISEAFLLALTQRPDFLAQKQQEQIIRHQEKAARYDWLPTLEIFGDYGINGETIDDAPEVWSVGIQVQVPVWDSYQRQGNLKGVQSQLVQIQNRTEDLKRSIDGEIRSLSEELGPAEGAVTVARETVSLQEKNLQLANDEYAAGTGTADGVVDAEVNLAEARYQEIETIYKYTLLRAAWFKALGNVSQSAE